ncbi:unnamed protein product, partial [Meganyctiphanes norvegica]
MESREDAHILEEPPHKKFCPGFHQGSHSIFEHNITKELIAPDALHIDNTVGYCSGEEENHLNYLEGKLEVNMNYAEEPTPKKFDYVVESRKQLSKKVKDYTEDQKSNPEANNVIMWLVAATSPVIDIIRWLQEHQLLECQMKCDHCESFMIWKTSNKATNGWKDGFYWKCINKNCSTLNCTKNIRVGSIFNKSKLYLKEWLYIMYKWSKNVRPSAITCNQVNISKVTITYIYSFFREVCDVYFKSNPIKLGGPGITIEIDVFSLSHEYSKKQKCESEPQNTIWILSIIDTTCTPSIGYMEIVETRDVVTLLPIILKVVQPGSIIRSKDWRELRKIQGLSGVGGAVNHSVNFVDVIPSGNNQTIVTYWNTHKSYLKFVNGTSRGNVKSYLQEYMWRKRFSNNALKILCEQIAVQYSDAMYIGNPNGSGLLDKTNIPENHLDVKHEENSHFLKEMSPKKHCPKIQNINHSIFEANVSQEPCAVNALYIDNKEGYCSEEENHFNYSERKLEVDMNYEEEPPTKKSKYRVQSGRQSSKKVKYLPKDQKPKPEESNHIVQLFAATTPVLDIIKWLQEHQLLGYEMKCDHCQSFMIWKTSNKATNGWKDGFYWKCINKNCPTLNCTKNIRMGSVFDKSKLYLKDWLHIMYKWSKNVKPSAASNQVNTSRMTVANIYSFFREVCEVYFKSNPIKLGGPGITIGIEVFSLSPEYSNKQKRVSEPQAPIRILVIVDTNCTPSIGYMQIVDAIDVATLFPIIWKVVQPGSTIPSKDWMSYCRIQGLSDISGSVNLSVNFVDVISSVYKQTIESYWEKHKSYLKVMSGTSRSNINSYLQEFMWRERFSDNALEILCEQITVQNSDASYIDKTDSSCLVKETKKTKKIFRGENRRKYTFYKKEELYEELPRISA